MKYLNKCWDSRDLGKYVGNFSQIAGIKEYELISGKGRGVRGVDFWTGSGFQFTVLPDRGMDISAASFNGLSLCWHSPTGIVHPSFFEPEGRQWIRNFFGGLLTTCGITYAGNPCVDEGEELGLHGRISNTPAESLCIEKEWDGEKYRLFIRGSLNESRLHGENVILTREITAYMGSSSLTIHDIIENKGYRTTPHMIIYHINVGFPFLQDKSQFISPSIEVNMQGETDSKEIENYDQMTIPTSNYQHKVFSLNMKADESGKVRCCVVNRELLRGGAGVYLIYNKNQLSNFSLWKMMGEGDYVLGMEPGNCTTEGRCVERKRGTLAYLEPGEKVEYELELGVLHGSDDIESFKKLIRMDY